MALSTLLTMKQLALFQITGETQFSDADFENNASFILACRSVRYYVWRDEHVGDILTIKANEIHYFSSLFGKELYMFRTDLLSIIRSLNTVITAIGIRHTGYVSYLLVRSGWKNISRCTVL